MKVDMNNIEEVKKALAKLDAQREILVKQLRKLIYSA